MSDGEFGNEKVLDNSGLEELMKQSETPESEVLEVLKKSQLIMPIDLGEEDYSIRYLTGDDGNRSVPLFTGGEMMQDAGEDSSVMALYMADLADILKGNDECSAITVNPGTEIEFSVPVGTFLDMF